MPRTLRVLLIEDSEFDAMLLTRILRKGGYEVEDERIETADELEQALKRPWDVVIADYNLPQFSAPDALEIIQKAGIDIPFIIVSGAIGETTAVSAMKAGASDYLMKDNLARLLPVIERELREAENREGKRQTKEALVESELRYRLLWETATDAVILFDDSGTINFANPAVEEVFGYSPDELIGTSLFQLQPESYHWNARGGLKRYMKSGATARNWRARETVGLKKNGEEFPIEAAFSTLPMETKALHVAFLRDITERKRAENELRENQEQFRVARDIQQHLFPHHAPQFEGLEIAGHSHPADATGGDYYDFLEMPDSSIGVVVGDVTGHGVGPALLMAEARAYLRILALGMLDAGAILTKANRVLSEDVGYERYITLFFARLNPAKRRIAYVNAGHIPGYIFGASGDVVSTLKRTGVPLGLRSQTIYQESTEIELASGQIVLMLTDGFEEAVGPDEEMFGTDRILDIVKKNRAGTADQILQALHNSLREFMGDRPQLDDLTAIVIKVK